MQTPGEKLCFVLVPMFYSLCYMTALGRKPRKIGPRNDYLMTDVPGQDKKPSVGGGPLTHAGVTTALETGTSGADFQPFRLETSAHDGGYAVSFCLDIPVAAYRADLRVIVDIEVESGAIGVGCMCTDFSAFVGVEQMILGGRRRKVFVATGTADTAKHLMLRNASHEGVSLACVYGIELRHIDASDERQASIRSSFWDVTIAELEPFPKTGGEAETARRALASIGAALGADLQAVTFPLALTHTSRVWDWQRCTRDFLRDRYQHPGRLHGLPPFEELRPAHEARSYSGRLTLFDLTIDGEGVNLNATRCIDSDHKLNHACRLEDKLVVCLEDFVVVLPADADAAGGDPERIDDPWFASLQTVFPVDHGHCVISASAPDALMVFDLMCRRVVWRWRVPADRYGRNYELTESMSVQDHFIANDIQLTHLNCAFPDGRGGFWISTLGQGDIGHVADDGSYELIASGFVGCHGVRYWPERDCLYFSDSCAGRLISIGADRVPRVIGTVDSCWLHDAQHLAGDIFLLCLGDKNAIVALDSSSNTEIARFDMTSRGENVQFVNRLGEFVYKRQGE